MILSGLLFFFGGIGLTIAAQNSTADISSIPASRFRIGEKLTYSVSFGKFDNAAYAQTCVVSRGKIDGKDAVELHSKIKTLQFVSAAFFLFDESRTVYASPETGLPLYINRSVNDGPLPKETVSNYLSAPTSNFDLLTLIFKAREAGGVGTFPLYENGKLYTVTFVPGETEKIKTAAGIFETTASTVQSDYFTSKEIDELKINFVADEAHVPALIRIKTKKGEFRAELSGITIPEPEVATHAPTPVLVPRPSATPKPSPSPQAYTENRPLAPELGFDLGESLDYKITTGGKPVATLNLSAKERKLFQKADSLLLAATITGAEDGNGKFSAGDSIIVRVNPETLAPRFSETQFGAGLNMLNQNLQFDQRTGLIKFGGPSGIDSPIGTHTILSLLYAMRSFNLKPSKDPNNPVNDTRVAVFWKDRAYIFVLRPSNPENLTINGESVSAQQIAVKTGNEQLDALHIKVWLTNDERRIPIRFSVGAYLAELASPPNYNLK